MAIPSEMTVSELPPAVRSIARRWFDANKDSAVARAKIHAAAGMSGLRAGGESLVVAGALGAAHALSPTGLDIKKVPVDAAFGAVALLASVGLATTEGGADLRNAGAAALAVFAFRKSHDVVRAIKLKQSGITPGGGAALPAGLGQPMSKIAGEGDYGQPYTTNHTSFGFNQSNFNGPRTGFFGADVGAEDPIVKAARYL